MAGVLFAVVATTFAVLLAPSALAANQAVSVADNAFISPRVAVKPGESVTWTTSGGNPHNVAFEDGGLVDPSPPRQGPWTTARTFAAEAAYRYFCEVHGGPGGQGMAGIVYVNAAANVPPLAALTISRNPAQRGETVSLSGSTSSDPEGIARYEWDLDGDGSFETNTGSTPTASRAYTTAGSITVRLRVTDTVGATDVATSTLRVNAPPTASFTASPNPAQTGAAVSFDGSGSSDSETSITRYEWDLDGNGSFETDTGSSPRATSSYTSPRQVAVKLRVSDSDGGTAQTTRSLQVNRGPVLAPALATSPPSFAASKRSIKVSRNGRFSYSFGARPGLSGTIALRSISKVSVSAKRRISLGTKRFTVPSSGTVKVNWKLSRTNLRTLKRNNAIRFRATVTLRSAAGAASSGAATLTLKKPTR